MDLLTIGGVAISGTNPCRFIAEVGANHDGNFGTAFNLVRSARLAGADFVKFQAYTLDEILALRGDGPAPEPWTHYGTLRQLYRMAITPLDWLPPLFAYARSVGIVPFASVFGMESLAALEAIDCPAYKIARYDNHATELIAAVRATGKPVVISASDSEVRWASEQPNLLTLYCPSGYPTKDEDVDLPSFGDHPFSGLSSHCLNPFLPIAAVAKGAKVMEYHIQLDDTPAQLDGSFSLTVSQFTQMIASVRQTERLLA